MSKYLKITLKNNKNRLVPIMTLDDVMNYKWNVGYEIVIVTTQGHNHIRRVLAVLNKIVTYRNGSGKAQTAIGDIGDYLVVKDGETLQLWVKSWSSLSRSSWLSGILIGYEHCKRSYKKKQRKV